MKALAEAGMNPTDPAGMDVAQIGLGAPPRPPLIGETPHPSGPGMEHGASCSYCLSLSFELSVPCAFGNSLVAIAGASDITISGWTDALEAVYKDIGGCLLFFPCYSIFSLMFLILGLLLGRLRHQLRSVDYFKLLCMNLEQQCVVCFCLLTSFLSLLFYLFFSWNL
jgi:hypothetical protein